MALASCEHDHELRYYGNISVVDINMLDGTDGSLEMEQIEEYKTSPFSWGANTVLILKIVSK